MNKVQYKAWWNKGWDDAAAGKLPRLDQKRNEAYLAGYRAEFTANFQRLNGFKETEHVADF